ncbi:hypothetical protein [Clostridium sporogenes]|uniref:hypothetical protein n=1 Tax=Clostridium sporogenes TaxID=1509 RepID=UPI000AD52307|nr:hypothetical protein [Clostridium sporogenes]
MISGTETGTIKTLEQRATQALKSIKNILHKAGNKSIEELNKIVTKVYSRVNGVLDVEVAGYGRIRIKESSILDDVDKICKDRYGKWAESKSSDGVGNPELKLISEYANNDVFSKSVSFNAGEGGTGITYKVFQRNDIDWDMIRTTGAKKGRGLTNAEAADRYGLAPILDADGNVGTLHHSQQHSVGPLFEVPTRYHNISNAKKAPLHPYKG